MATKFEGGGGLSGRATKNRPIFFCGFPRPVAIKPARDLTVAVDVKLYPGTNITNKQQEVQEKEFYDSARKTQFMVL